LNKQTIEKLKEQLPKLKILLNEILPTVKEDHEEILLDLLESSLVSTSIKILQTIDNKAISYEEIAESINIHENTVKQYISLLEEYFIINENGKIAIASTGRCRKLISKN
jgi:predicted AAA+ superfamily ATPase